MELRGENIPFLSLTWFLNGGKKFTYWISVFSARSCLDILIYLVHTVSLQYTIGSLGFGLESRKGQLAVWTWATGYQIMTLSRYLPETYVHLLVILLYRNNIGRSQCLSGLRHELSRTLWSWVRIPLKVMDVCVCVYSVFVLSYVQVATLRLADHSSKESYSLCKKDYGTKKEARAQQRTVEPLMDEWMRNTIDNLILSK
jgi:hypothetical protein